MEALKAALKEKLNSLPASSSIGHRTPNRRHPLVRSPSPIKLISSTTVSDGEGDNFTSLNTSGNGNSTSNPNVTYDVENSGDSSGNEVEYDEILEKFMQERFGDLSLDNTSVPKLFVKVCDND